MRFFFIKPTLLFAFAIGGFLTTLSVCTAQNITPMEPISLHYKTLADLNSSSNPSRAWMDTVSFPDYGAKSLATTMRPVYLLPEDSAKLRMLVHYPANSSEQTRAELDYLLKVQETRTPEEVKRSGYISGMSSTPHTFGKGQRAFFIATVAGDWLTTQNFPEIGKLLENCGNDIRFTEFFLKRDFKRSRPYHLEPKLKPVNQVATPSFPGGHALWAFADAFVLSEIIPEKRAEFLKLAEEVRWSREVLGIHFPSDDEAGRVIGWHLLESWYHNPKFVADMEKAKAEWKEKKNSFK